MKTGTGITIGVLIGCGALAAYVGTPQAQTKSNTATAIASSTRAGEAKESPALGCDFHAGDRFGFSIDEQSNYVVSSKQVLGAGSSGNAPSRETRTIRGDMLVRVLDDPPHDGALTLAAVMETPDVAVAGVRAAAVEAELGKPVLFRMDRTCKMVGFVPSVPLQVATANLWKLTLKMAETIIPAPGTQSAWKVELSDGTGTYTASYTRNDKNGMAELQRTRGGYKTIHHDGGGAVTAEVLRSQGVAHVLPGHGWVADVSVQEHVALKASGATMADVETSLSFAGHDVSNHPSGFWTRALSGQGMTFGPIETLEQPPPSMPYADRAPIEGLRDKTPSVVLADVMARLAIKPQGDYDAALNLLVQYIRLDPKNARALLDQARRGEIDDATRSVLWLGMGLAGGRDAHAALVEALGDRRLSELDRNRALAALAGVPDPDRAVTDAILGARDSSLALGSLAHNAAVSTEDKQRIMATLTADLGRAGTSEAKINALTALGNAGDATARDRVAALIGDKDPLVSAAAYRSLKLMGGLPPSGELLDAFMNASDSREQAVIAEASGGMKLDEAGVARAASLLPQETRANVRAFLVSLLGASATDNPVAKAALVAQLKVEREPAILTLIGRYIKPSDMH